MLRVSDTLEKLVLIAGGKLFGCYAHPKTIIRLVSHARPETAVLFPPPTSEVATSGIRIRWVQFGHPGISCRQVPA
jgi:hypothetical protein